MLFTESIKCIYYNTLSTFYIALNVIFPYYNEEILHLQYKTIGYINEDIIFVSNSRKRKRFNLFIENLINKNLELIEKIKKQEEEDNNINNYEKVVDSQDDTDETSTQEDVQDIQEEIQENVDNEYERDDTFDKED
jgi:hypothetical protein